MESVKRIILLFLHLHICNADILFNDPVYVKGYQDWYLDAMGVPKAWERCLSGKGVVVAVVDRGVNGNHPDLYGNYDDALDLDVQRNLDTAQPVDQNEVHGTNSAGVIAAVRNDFCGVGIAFEATITGVRLFGAKKLTDEMEGRALSHRLDRIDIYSNSWGPPGSAQTVNPVGPRANQAFQQGIIQGRYGRGAIYVFAAGNGGIYQDSCAYDGYVNDIRTIAVTAVHQNGHILQSSERCSAVFVSAYSRNKLDDNSIITTTDKGSGCTGSFGRSSAAAPQVSAIIALALQANSKLGWRDVQHILARSADYSRLQPWREDTFVNGAGFKLSSAYGFGLVSADKAVDLASKWRNVGQMQTCDVAIEDEGQSVPRIFQKYVSCNDIRYLEHVEVSVDITYCVRGYIVVIVTSPRGTKSVVMPGRIEDIRSTSLKMTSSSVHFWGEDPNGAWTVEVKPLARGKVRCRGPGVARNIALKLHGSFERPGILGGSSLNDYCPIKKGGQDESELDRKLRQLKESNLKQKLHIDALLYKLKQYENVPTPVPTWEPPNSNQESGNFSTAGCSNARLSPPITDKILKAQKGQSVSQLGVTDFNTCKTLCLADDTCLSITFIENMEQLTKSGEWEHYGQRCFLNSIRADEGNLRDPPRIVRGLFAIMNKECN